MHQCKKLLKHLVSLLGLLDSTIEANLQNEPTRLVMRAHAGHCAADPALIKSVNEKQQTPPVSRWSQQQPDEKM